jgi:1-acyl-sn-glycerol-3-phosphate acyltransferase
VIPAVTDSGRCWGRRAFHKRPGTVHIRLLEPIPAGIGREELLQRLAAALRSDVLPSAEPVENSVG